jgi:hypothetical protein
MPYPCFNGSHKCPQSPVLKECNSGHKPACLSDDKPAVSCGLGKQNSVYTCIRIQVWRHEDISEIWRLYCRLGWIWPDCRIQKKPKTRIWTRIWPCRVHRNLQDASTDWSETSSCTCDIGCKTEKKQSLLNQRTTTIATPLSSSRILVQIPQMFSKAVKEGRKKLLPKE